MFKPMSKKPKMPGSAVAMIYARRQGRRPHYLAEIMAQKNIQRSQLITDLDMDKGMVSRWLDKQRPSTPSPDWAQKLGRYFASDPDDFVDIFTDPALSRFQRLTRKLSQDEVTKALDMIEIMFRRTG